MITYESSEPDGERDHGVGRRTGSRLSLRPQQREQRRRSLARPATDDRSAGCVPPAAARSENGRGRSSQASAESRPVAAQRDPAEAAQRPRRRDSRSMSRISAIRVHLIQRELGRGMRRGPACSASRAASFFRQHEVARSPATSMCVRHEAAVGVLGRADDRLAANVEAGVDHDRAPGLLASNRSNEAVVEAREALGIDRSGRAPSTIHVGDRGDDWLRRSP